MSSLLRVLGLLLLLPVFAWSQDVCVPQVGTPLGFTLRWSPPAVTPGSPLVLRDYILERQLGTGPWVALATVPLSSAPSYRDSPLAFGQTYSYRVAARYFTSTQTLITSAWAARGTGANAPCITVPVVTPPGNLTGTQD